MSSAPPDDLVEVLGDLVIRTDQGTVLVAAIKAHDVLRPLLEADRPVRVTGNARWLPQWDGDRLCAICLRLQLRCAPRRILLVRFALAQGERTLAHQPGRVVLMDCAGFADLHRTRVLQRGLVLPTASAAVLAELLAPAVTPNAARPRD